MNQKSGSVLYRIAGDESGQILPWVGILIMLIFAGLSALVVDVGRGIVAYHMLQASTDAAAMAGVQIMPGATSVADVKARAIKFDSEPGNYNANAVFLPNAAMATNSPNVYCSAAVKAGLGADVGVACTGAGGTANAITVTQYTKIPMYFASWIGFKDMTIAATSSASMAGAQTGPFNIAVVIDTTASMQQGDNTGSCTTSRITCALTGFQSLLNGLYPCVTSGSSKTCTPYDSVSLFTYPNIQANTAKNDTTCTTNAPTIIPYSTPGIGAAWVNTNYSSTAATYQVSTYLNDWSSNNQAIGTNGTYNNSSALTVAAGASTTRNCKGLQAKGGEGTYFAAAVYAAASSLAAQQAANPDSKNALIILSDGDANAKTSEFKVTSPYTQLSTKGTYPSAIDQCQQAIDAASYAADMTDSRGNPDTRVYTIAYGANASSTSSCSTDNPHISACNTLKKMASDPSYFYSTDGPTGACPGATPAIDSLEGIFGDILSTFTRARLIPSGTS